MFKMRRAALVLAAVAAFASPGLPAAREAVPVAAESQAGRALVERLRAGGLVLFFRHADTRGMPCDSGYRIGEREGQRNISPAGRDQARSIGAALERLGVPVQRPVIAGPVFRARDTAELAFGADAVEVTDELLADDYAGGRLSAVLDGHRRLLAQAPPAGLNRVLVGHRTPAIMVLGPAVDGAAFPEGAALVLEPGATARLLGILELAPLEGGGFHDC